MLRENTPISFELTLAAISEAVYTANCALEIHSGPLSCLPTRAVLLVSPGETVEWVGTLGLQQLQQEKNSSHRGVF